MTDIERMEAELLAESSNIKSVAASNVCYVDDDARQINIPENCTLLGVRNDKNTKRVCFRAPRFVGDNIDLSKLRMRVNYENALGQTGQYLVEDLTVDGDYVTFSWKIKKSVTVGDGTVKFSLCAVTATVDGYVEEAWHTTTAVGRVLATVEATGGQVEPAERDVVLQLIEMTEAAAEKNLQDIADLTESSLGALQDESVKQQKQIEATGALTAASIPSDYTFVANLANDNKRDKASAIKRTYAGEVIKISECSNDGFSGLRVFGRSEQASTSGKNLFDIETWLTDKGATWSKNGEIYNVRTTQKLYNEPYVFSETDIEVAFYSDISNVSSTKARIELLDSSGKNTGIMYEDGSAVICKACAIRINWTNAGECVISYPQLELGTEATPYEPYTGGKPSPSVDYPQSINSVGDDGSVDVGVYSGNLLPYPYINTTLTKDGVTYTDIGDGGIALSGVATAYSEFVLYNGVNKFKGKTSFKLLGEYTNIQPTIYLRDSNGISIYSYSSFAKNIVIDFNNYPTCTNVYFGIKRSDNVAVSGTVYPMIVAGDVVPTEYERGASSQSLTISTPNGLPAIKVTDPSLATYTDQNGIMWCADEIDFARGKYVQRVNTCILTGEEPFKIETHNVYGTRFLLTTGLNPAYDSMNIKNLFSHGEWVYNANNTFNSENKYAIYNTGHLFMNLKNSKTLEDFKSILMEEYAKGTPVTIEYILATPIETDLTQAEITAFKLLHSNYPNTLIMNDFNARMEVTYNVDTDTYLDNTYGKTLKRLDASNTIKRTYSGDAIAATDSAEAKFECLRVFGRSEQFSTTGAQLLPYPYVDTTKTVNGVTFTDNGDGTITVNGTATEQANFVLMSANAMSGTFTLSGCPSGGSSGGYSIQPKIDGVWNVENYDTGSGKKITVNNEITTVLIVIASETTVNNLVFKPMLNEGDIALPWEKFTGRKPSPNPDYPQPIESVGDDGNVDIEVYRKNLASDIYSEYSQNNNYSYRLINKNKNAVTVSITERDNSVDLTGCSFGLIENPYKIANGYKWFVEEGKLKTSVDTVYFGNIFIYPNTEEAFNKIFARYNIQIEFGSKATDYEPYKPVQNLQISTPNGLPGIKVTDASLATYTDADGQMWCSDEIDHGRGKYVQRIGTWIFDGNEKVQMKNTEDYCQIQTLITGTSSENCICTHLRGQKGYTTKNKPYVRTNVSGIWFEFNYGEYADSDNFKTFLAEQYANGTPVIVKYVLETPIETDLTSEEIEAYRALTSNYPTTTILNDENAYMEATMVADTKNHIEQNYVPKSEFLSVVDRVSALEQKLVQ